MISSKRKIVDNLHLKPNVKRARLALVYSNNLSDNVKTFCCQCDKVVTLSGLEDHIKVHSKMTMKEYKELYGDLKRQIIKPVYHNCGLCSKDLLLDSSVIKNHLRKKHQEGFASYCKKFMTPAKEENGIIIKCDKCSKPFKRNIQLKAHSKRHNMSDMDNVMFRGFEITDTEHKMGSLDKLIKVMETSLRREKQAFQQLLSLTYY